MNDPLPTSDENNCSVNESPEFQQAVADCIHQLESGHNIDANWLARKYPEWHRNLAVFIADWDAVEGYSNEVRSVQNCPDFSTDIPDSIGEYQVLEQIGIGGMGVIYKVQHQRLAQPVALKMLHNVRHDRRRFEMEAEAAARLDHPNIVSVIDVDEDDGHPFFTMPFIDGCDLDQLISQKKLSPQRAATIGYKISLAVQYAHQRGILHRDLKPGNILIDPDDEPHITDFGLPNSLNVQNT